jgi:spore germination cell wall hydrolase CwlJ-like protein
MTKRIEQGLIVVSACLSVLLVAQLHKADVPDQARQLNEIELTGQQIAVSEPVLKTEPAKEVVSKPVAHVHKTIDAAPSEDRMFAYAQKCFKNWECYKLAEATYFEDRGGGLDGMKAVANVIVNRTNTDGFPSSIAAVVNQKKYVKKTGWVCQFSYMCQLKDRRMIDTDSKYMAGYVAWTAYEGVLKDTTRGATHYLNESKVASKPKWVYAFNKTAKIGAHTFYVSKNG